MARKYNRPLSLKQQIFCEEYSTNGNNGLQAIKKAGYKGSDNTLAVQANKNLIKPNIMAYMNKRKLELAEKFDFNKDIAVSRAEEHRQIALNKADIAGANGALTLQCKLFGLITEKTQSITSPEAQAMDEQRKAEAVRVAKIVRLHQKEA